jgi:hypothetical protein
MLRFVEMYIEYVRLSVISCTSVQVLLIIANHRSLSVRCLKQNAIMAPQVAMYALIHCIEQVCKSYMLAFTVCSSALKLCTELNDCHIGQQYHHQGVIVL